MFIIHLLKNVFLIILIFKILKHYIIENINCNSFLSFRNGDCTLNVQPYTALQNETDYKAFDEYIYLVAIYYNKEKTGPYKFKYFDDREILFKNDKYSKSQLFRKVINFITNLFLMKIKLVLAYECDLLAYFGVKYFDCYKKSKTLEN